MQTKKKFWVAAHVWPQEMSPDQTLRIDHRWSKQGNEKRKPLLWSTRAWIFGLKPLWKFRKDLGGRARYEEKQPRTELTKTQVTSTFDSFQNLHYFQQNHLEK